jgi:SPOR domain
MRDLYSDDYESVAGDGAARLLPEGARRLAGALVFLGLVALMGVWAWRLGTRDAAEVPIIKAMAGPSRIEPEDPGGLRAAHQGLEVNSVLAGRPAPAPRAEAPARPTHEVLTAEDAPQGELVLAAPAILAERVLNEAGELSVPPSEEPGDLAPDAKVEVSAADAGPGLFGAEVEVPLGIEPALAGPRPMNRPSNLVVARARTTPAAAPAKPKPDPVAAPAAREVSAARPGSRMVQLGAYDSEEMTRRAWSRLVAANPDLLSTKSLYVERTTANARVFYRLRVAGFESTDQTRVMCESLRARGVDCIPVTLH